MSDFRTSKLWISTLGTQTNDSFESLRNRLRTVYESFWKRGVELAQRISTDLPELTLHDEAHLAALWDCASLLTGDRYSINPLEAFVFGGAVLLHDAGHAFAAYEGGLEELKKTVEYRDAVAAILRRSGKNPPDERDIEKASQETVKVALFVALRRLHASQAQTLATRAFDGLHLIGDKELRDNLAQLIGRIATSHHWDRVSLANELPEVQGAPNFLPQEWSIRPVKLACLLRCADAIQIDQRRAPAFAFALHAPRGQSELHWLAQQLAQPIVKADADGGAGALVFTSQNDFPEDKADSWWIAHDLVRNANEELQGCYQLMKDLRLPAFMVDRVAGAESPRMLEQRIRTVGWRPVSAEVRVTSVEQIVRLFGGAALYGFDVAVPLRELIQNASDAVRARRKRTDDPFYRGKVVVSLQTTEEEGFYELIVEDDGIGMAEHILAGPLIEFGKSFWASEEVQSEFPGLISAKLRQTGRFGIGFFSILMVAERIVVTSRRWDAGLDQARSLLFREGLRLRPLISKARGPSLNQFSTRVALKISTKNAEQLLTAFENGQDHFKITLKELVGHLCPCLDCDVFVQELMGSPELAHSQTWNELDPSQWVRGIVWAQARSNQYLDDYLAKAAPLMRVIEGPDGEPCGRAAIAFGRLESGIDSVGGFASSQHSRIVGSFSRVHIGALGFEPDGLRRGTGPQVAPKARIEAWASEQANLVAQMEVSDLEKYLAAINVAGFGGDPTPIARILVNREVQPLQAVYDLLADGKEILAVVGPSSRDRTRALSLKTVTYQVRAGYGIGLSPKELSFVRETLEGWGGRVPEDQAYHEIPTENFPAPSSFVSCLERHAASKCRKLKTEILPNVLFATYIGEASPRDGLSSGTEVRGPACKFWLE